MSYRNQYYAPIPGGYAAQELGWSQQPHGMNFNGVPIFPTSYQPHQSSTHPGHHRPPLPSHIALPSQPPSANAVLPASPRHPSRRRCIDIASFALLPTVWVFLAATALILLYYSRWDFVSVVAVQTGMVRSCLPLLVATILNEVLIDRCWRRITCAALGRHGAHSTVQQLARAIRAANFEWISILKRRPSFRDLRAATSYVLLRWGTAMAIASVQLTVSFDPVDPNSPTYVPEYPYAVDRRLLWLPGPILIHGLSILLALAVWLLPPWSVFSGRYDEVGMLHKYQPFLSRVQGGSLASYEDVARHLDPGHRPRKSLAKKHKPGLQIKAKLIGVWLGLLCVCLPPIILFLLTRSSLAMEFRYFRFLIHFAFLAQNIFYLLALDFVVWNLSLEGLSKGNRTKPVSGMRHLNTSSGVMLLIKACKQRLPIRAFIFFWLFWLQACAMRFFTTFWTLAIHFYAYGDDGNYRDQFYEPDFWLGWVILTGLIVFPLFLLWLFMPFHAPICGQGGWRWAKIAESALYEDGNYGVLGYYEEGNHGVMRYKACWGAHVETFEDAKGRLLD